MPYRQWLSPGPVLGLLSLCTAVQLIWALLPIENHAARLVFAVIVLALLGITMIAVLHTWPPEPPGDSRQKQGGNRDDGDDGGGDGDGGDDDKPPSLPFRRGG